MEKQLCDICKLELGDADSNDWVDDDAGLYHEDCYDAYVGKQADYWKSIITLAQKYEGVDESSAYEHGDPKNPEYVDWVLDQVDSQRKQ
jgi:hypothetical protein